MANSPIDEIKERLDVVGVIKSYIKVEKCGANYRARCPFHSENKPSFFISPSRQIWHCFGCGKGGDIFGFVKEIEGVDFGEALRILAKKAGIELKKIRPEERSKKQRLYEICDLSCKFFEKQLEASQTGEKVRKYLTERGINDESIAKWRIGYAPDKPRSLTNFLRSRDYSFSEIEKVGLTIRNKRGDYFDRFQSRIIFPIFDLHSQIIAFGGRIFGPKAEDEIAKYLNSPGTVLYDKSRTLYGLDKAKIEIRKRDFTILVEGYTDCITAHQAGYKNTVAVSGTALTASQLKILKRYSQNLVTAFDMDLAGNTATKRGIDLAQSLDFNIKVITMPEGKDPADVISQDLGLWKKLLKDSKSILDFYFNITFSKFDKSKAEDKKEISKIILPVIKRIPNRILQAHWIQKLAQQLGVRMEDIEEEMNKIKIDDTEEEKEEIEEEPKTRKEKIEERLISLLFREPNLSKEVEKEDISFLSEKSASVVSKIKENLEEDSNLNFDDFEKGLSQEEKDFINPLVLRSEIESEFVETKPEEEVSVCLDEIRAFGIKEKLKNLSDEIRKSEEDKDSERTKELIKKFNELAQKLNNN
jgi:DNA primase